VGSPRSRLPVEAQPESPELCTGAGRAGALAGRRSALGAVAPALAGMAADAGLASISAATAISAISVVVAAASIATI